MEFAVGLLLESGWNSNGIWSEFCCILMIFGLRLTGIWLEFCWNSAGSLQELSWKLANRFVDVCLIFARICMKFEWHLAGIWVECAWTLAEIWVELGWNFGLEFCWRLAGTWLEFC